MDSGDNWLSLLPPQIPQRLVGWRWALSPWGPLTLQGPHRAVSPQEARPRVSISKPSLSLAPL